jgi:CIC family chloride channel protein
LDHLHYLPLTLPFFSILVGIFAGLVLLIEIGILRYAYMRIGIGSRAALLLLFGSLFGSYFNIAVAQLPGRQILSGQEVTYFGIPYAVPVVVDWPGTVLAVNVGGAVIPTAMSLYLLAKNRFWVRGLLATFCVAMACHRLATPVPGLGIALPVIVPSLTTAIVALLLSRQDAAPLAYISGSLGTLIGADLLNLGSLQGLGAPVASIGGAGTFDGIFLVAWWRCCWPVSPAGWASLDFPRTQGVDAPANRHRWFVAETLNDAAAAATAPARDEPAGTAAIAGEREPRPLSLWSLCGFALIMGSFTGFGAVVFRALIGLVHNVLFLGHPWFAYDASHFTPPSPWGALVILVPVIGSFGVTFIVNTFAPEAKGHGVPEVMDAIFYQRGLIRPVVAVAKSLASALAIGSGAAVGREGPIIQIGSALGSTLGQLVAMPVAQRITLVAAGAGAGIAATFNTPIGGVLFATELLLPEVSVNTFLPVALATGSATFIGRLFFGAQPAFAVPVELATLPNQPSSVVTLLLYAVLGALVGAAAALFVRSLHWVEDIFDRIPGSYLRHAIGMLLVGVLIYLLMITAGHYYVEGVGYATIQATLNGQMVGGLFFLLLFVCKLAATNVSLGSGSSGGIFSPSLFMGATLGAAFASFAGALLPGVGLSMPAFAMVGMGAMVGSGTGAAMTAVTMIFEMTRDYDIVLPMILAVALSLGVRRLFSRQNIYTMKLVGRGHAMPRGLHANLFLVRSARDVMLHDVAIMDQSTTFSALLMSQDAGGLRHVVVTRGNRIAGVLRVNTDLRRAVGAAGADVTLGELVRPNFTVVREDAAVFDVITRMRRKGAATALVIPRGVYPGANRILGVITKEQIADSVASSISLYPR